MIKLLPLFLIFSTTFGQQYIGDGSFQPNSIYYTSFDHDTTTFRINQPFQIVYIKPFTNPSNLNWVYPPSCSPSKTVVSSVSASTNFTCTTPGIFRFQVQDTTTNVDNLVDVYINIEPDTFCYQWVFRMEDNKDLQVLPNQGFLEAKIWVMDKISGEDEGTSPSLVNRGLSKSFASAGSVPVFTFSTLKKFLINNITFDDDNGLWNLVFNTTESGPIPFTIKDTGSVVFNCLAEPSQYTINVNRFSVVNTRVFTPTSPNLPVLDSEFSFFPDTCLPNHASFLIPKLGLQNLFYSAEIPTSDQLLMYNVAQDDKILSVTYTSSSVLVLLESQLRVYKVQNGTAANFSPSSLSNVKITNITATQFCDGSVYDSYVVAWSNSPVSQSQTLIYLSRDSGATFSSHSISLGTFNGDGFIVDVLIQPSFKNLLVVLRSRNNQYQVKFLALDDLTVVDGVVLSTDAFTNALPRVKMAGPHGGDVFLYGNQLFYSPNGGLNFFTHKLLNRSKNPVSQLFTREFIKQMVTNTEGEYAVLASNNRIFVGKSGILDAIEISSGLPTTSNAAILYDTLGKLSVVELNPSATTVGNLFKYRYVPVKNEINVPRPPEAKIALSCPFHHWESTLNESYYLDMGESFNFSATLVQNKQQPNGISVAVNNKLIKLSTKTQEDQIQIDRSLYGIQQLYGNVTVDLKDLDTGRSELIVRPQFANIACDTVAMKSTVYRACPAKRRIVVKRAPSDDVTCRPETPSEIYIPAGTFISNWTTMEIGEEDKILPYSCKNWGPPIQGSYDFYWKPQLDLYDGDTFIAPVTGDFVLWEVNGRRTFTYSMTAQDAKCQRAPQTWESLIKSGGYYDDPTRIWNSENYQNCFIDDQKDDKFDSLYQVFNSTNSQSISWTGLLDGVYVFTAIVVDPEYSFCKLSTTFAVQVYGAPLKPVYQTLILLGLVCLMLIPLVYAFFYSKKKMQKRTAIEAEEKKKN